MLRYLKYTFPAVGFDQVAKLQTVAAGGNYILNGDLSLGNKVSFISKGYSRQISIHTAAGDHSGVTFTVNGKQNGVSLSIELAGPNSAISGGTVYSETVFDSIDSVTVDSDPGNCTIGTGLSGFFHLIKINNLRKNVQYSLSLESSVNANQIPTVVYTTVDNIEANGLTFQDIIADSISSLYTVKASSQLTQYSVQYPYTSSLSIPAGAPPLPLLTNYYLIALNGDNTTLNSGMTLIFTQV